MERARMERVFSNLFENAIEAMRSGGQHLDWVRGERRKHLVRVEDTGPGINPALRGRLFQPFVTAGKKNGLGWAWRCRGKRCWIMAAICGWTRTAAGASALLLRLPNGPLHRQGMRRGSESEPLAFACDLPFFVGANYQHSAPRNRVHAMS